MRVTLASYLVACGGVPEPQMTYLAQNKRYPIGTKKDCK
jgi:hypothetical protein